MDPSPRRLEEPPEADVISRLHPISKARWSAEKQHKAAK